MITEEQYKKAKEIVNDYEAQEMDKHRFCKGCEMEVSKTMICKCSGQPLTQSMVYTAQELIEKPTIAEGFLQEYATKNNDGFIDVKQKKWILEAMEAYSQYQEYLKVW